GAQHLIAFALQTDGWPGGEHSVPPSNLVAIRLDRDLTPIDAEPIAIGVTPNGTNAPRIAFNVARWNVSWQHFPGYKGPPAPQTRMLGPDRMHVSWLQSGAMAQAGPAIAAADGQRLVIFREVDQSVPTARLFAMRLSRDGAQLQEPEMLDADALDAARTAR